MKAEIIANIIELEWDMFHNVHNEGGMAACQMNREIFEIMRESQCSGWSEALLTSWLADLIAAKNERRNLMSEKYARMMEFNYPEEYARIKDQLPPVDVETARKINEIVAIHLEWKEALNSEYPHLAERGRPLRGEDDRPGFPSVETYMRGELQTYSPRTIGLYYEETQKRLERGQNEAAENLLAQVKRYGFSSLAEAEEYFKNKSRANSA